MTANEAFSVGVPVASGSASRDFMVLVRDYRRAFPCIANDQKTELLYGQVVRTVIEMHGYEASLGSSLQAIAASGTLNRRNQQVYVYKDGFYNPKIDGLIAEISGKAFDVDGYAVYQQLVPRMVALLEDNNTTFSVNKIGIRRQITDESLAASPVVAYAISRIGGGGECAKAQRKFADLRDREIVAETYAFFGEDCGNYKPSGGAQAQARSMLKGVKIK